MARMITEEQIDKLVEMLVKNIQNANVYFIENIAEMIKEIGELTPSKAHELIQLLRYGENYDEIVQEVSRLTRLNIRQVEDIFEAYAKKDQAFYRQFYEARGLSFIPYNENLTLRRQTLALASLTQGEMQNFARTNILGYTIRDMQGNTQFLGLRQTYDRVLDEAILNVGQGKETFDSAMARIMKEIGGSGLKYADYKSGRSVRLDSAVRQSLKQGLRALHNENQLIIGEEIQSDGVEISVHSYPAPDHAKAQGRQFSNEEFDKLNSGLEAKDYKGRKVTLDHDHNNSFRQISTLNCYHYIFTIVLGVSKPEYTDEELKDILEENDKGVEINGKHYTLYQATQMQRSLERRIREQKDIQIMGRASGNKDLINDAQGKVTDLTRAYKELSDKSGLPFKSKRLQVVNYRRTSTKK